MAERKEWWEILRDQFASRGLLDPESERIQEAVSAAPAVKRQARGLLSLDPQAESDTVLEMGLGSLPGTGQLMALRDLERARRAKDPGAAAMAASNFIPFGTLLNRFRRGPMSELDVYHGTPHRFPGTEANPLGEFDASKIGTGEGAQAYGHGVYYAENPEVAKGYQPRDPKAEAKLMNLYKQAEARQNYDAMEVLEAAMLHRTASELREQFPKQKGLVTRIGKINEKAAGSLYKADLPDEMIDRMLDWDKPLREQAPNIQEVVSRYIIEMEPYLPSNSRMKYLALNQRVRDADITGAELYKNAQELLGSQLTAALLKKQGIPGIRYLDAGSRDGGSGTRNFVVFPGEEKKVKILERK
jgi:hypothetical protein